MQQAYNYFNSGKYKEALNTLMSSHSNAEAYESNLSILEYLNNRCLQSAMNCLRKMNDLLNRRIKREVGRLQCQSESMLKLNISILLILLGKRDHALLILKDLYESRECFISFMQSRIFLLLLELNTNLKNSMEVLFLYRKYPLKPNEQQRVPSQHWTSLLLHEHNKSFCIIRQEFNFITSVLITRALIQLGVSEQTLRTHEEHEIIEVELLQKVHKRKSNISKYYEINLLMITRFLKAERQLHYRSEHHYQNCLSLMNFGNIQKEFDQLPSSKFVTNILNSLTTNNSGIVHFCIGKPVIALQYFIKARNLLSKSSTVVEDKDLQLFACNSVNHIQELCYNVSLALLASKSSECYHSFVSTIRNNKISSNFKYWYRAGQATLEYFYEAKINKEEKIKLMELAHSYFRTALSILETKKFIDLEMHSLYPMISEEEFEELALRINCEMIHFKQSIKMALCYIGLYLQDYHQVIRIGTSMLKDKRLRIQYRIDLLHYLYEAFMKLNRMTDLEGVISQLETTTISFSEEPCRASYEYNGAQKYEDTNYGSLLLYLASHKLICEQRFIEAEIYVNQLRQKQGTKVSVSMLCLLKYMHSKMNYTSGFMKQYQKELDNK